MGRWSMAATGNERIDFSKTMMGDDPIGPLGKLLWEILFIRRHGPAADVIDRLYMSWNAAATAWHIHEWMWKRYPEEDREKLAAMVGAAKASRESFAAAVRERSQFIMVCCQIATAGKHVTIDHERRDLTVEHLRDESTGEVAVWICLGENRMPDVDVYALALRWWIDLYIDAGFPKAAALRSMLEK